MMVTMTEKILGIVYILVYTSQNTLPSMASEYCESCIPKNYVLSALSCGVVVVFLQQYRVFLTFWIYYFKWLPRFV